MALGALAAAIPAHAAKITAFPLAIDGSAFDLAIGPDGNPWFTIEQDRGRRVELGRLTSSGVLTRFEMDLAPTFATSSISVKGKGIGPDGQLWFAFSEQGGGGIARIDGLGNVTVVYRVVPAGRPIASSPPAFLGVDLTTGPDGNLWVADINGDRIGRITPSGVATWFQEGITPNSGPIDIAVGPDGNLWFTEVFGARIGRITTSGEVREFDVRRPRGTEPSGIAVGADGNLWYADFYDRIGRISPQGALTTFSAGITQMLDRYPSASPADIAAGSDGNLWFTESNNGSVGRITPRGAITEFSTPRKTSSPLDIVSSPDGSLWYLDGSRKRLGRIVPDKAPAPRIAILTRRAAVSRRGYVKVKLGCGPGSGRCVGSLALSSTGAGGAAGTRYAVAPFSFDARRRATILLKLSKRARRLLAAADQGRLPTRMVAATNRGKPRRRGVLVLPSSGR